MVSRPESESGSWECWFEILGVIDEGHGVSDVAFLLKFAQERLDYRGRHCRKQPNTGDLVRFRFNSSVQPVLLFVDSDHGFVERDVIRLALLAGCRSAFYTQSSTAFCDRWAPNSSGLQIVSGSDTTARHTQFYTSPVSETSEGGVPDTEWILSDSEDIFHHD